MRHGGLRQRLKLTGFSTTLSTHTLAREEIKTRIGQLENKKTWTEQTKASLFHNYREICQDL